MGGLVARLAVLTVHLPNVRRIVTLATPNSGTLTGMQISIVGHMALRAFRTVWALFPRKRGIIELTNAHSIMRRESETIYAKHPERLNDKAYISIPARFYNRRRSPTEKSPSIVMGGLSLGFSILNYAVRHRMVKLEPAHDGIVEERDVCLNPCSQGSRPETEYLGVSNEKNQRVRHVSHRNCDDLDHVTVAHDPEIAKLVAAVLSAPNLSEQDIEAAMGPPYLLDFRTPAA